MAVRDTVVIDSHSRKERGASDPSLVSRTDVDRIPLFRSNRRNARGLGPMRSGLCRPKPGVVSAGWGPRKWNRHRHRDPPQRSPSTVRETVTTVGVPIPPLFLGRTTRTCRSYGVDVMPLLQSVRGVVRGLGRREVVPPGTRTRVSCLQGRARLVRPTVAET